MHAVPYDAHETVRIGLVGAGGRGRSLLSDFARVPGVEFRAIWDPNADSMDKAMALEGAAGAHPYREATDLVRLVDRDDLDLVVIASPWEHHTTQAVAAMRAGKHVAVEVPAATTIEDCHRLVEVSEHTRRHCVMLENCCYGRNELMVRNMVRHGFFGDLTHAEAAYIHDLRSTLFDGVYEGPWRRQPHQERDGNLYPTHGLGPVAWYMDVGGEDRFEYMVSMSSRERALSEYRDKHVPGALGETYRCGDMNSSLIRTKLGRTILLQHDVVSPRPYDRLNLLSGTKASFRDYPARIYVDGQEKHEWQDVDALRPEWDDPVWTEAAEGAAAGGHGGMDYVMARRLVQAMQKGVAPDMDVYDAADWSAPGPLSEASVATGSSPIAFPNFRR